MINNNILLFIVKDFLLILINLGGIFLLNQNLLLIKDEIISLNNQEEITINPPKNNIDISNKLSDNQSKNKDADDTSGNTPTAAPDLTDIVSPDSYTDIILVYTPYIIGAVLTIFAIYYSYKYISELELYISNILNTNYLKFIIPTNLNTNFDDFINKTVTYWIDNNVTHNTTFLNKASDLFIALNLHKDLPISSTLNNIKETTIINYPHPQNTLESVSNSIDSRSSLIVASGAINDITQNTLINPTQQSLEPLNILLTPSNISVEPIVSNSLSISTVMSTPLNIINDNSRMVTSLVTEIPIIPENTNMLTEFIDSLS